jgi:hypothetical protein
MSPLTTKAQSLKVESKTYEAQLEDQKAKKGSRRSSRRGKTAMPTKDTKSSEPSKIANKSQEKLKIKKLKTPPEINSP